MTYYPLGQCSRARLAKAVSCGLVLGLIGDAGSKCKREAWEQTGSLIKPNKAACL